MTTLENKSFDIIIKRYKKLPTLWTGLKGQKPNKKLEAEYFFDNIETLEQALEIINYHFSTHNK